MGERKRLTFKDVKVKSLDNKSPYVYPSRTIEIELDKKVVTPTRAATLTEYHYKAGVPTRTAIQNTVSLSILKMNLAHLSSFLNENGTYHSLSRRLSANNDIMKYSALRAHIVQPTLTKTKKQDEKGKTVIVDSAVDYLVSNPEKREQFLRFIIKLQSDQGLDIISIPYLNLPLSDYSKLAKDVTERLRKVNLEPLFVFDLDYQKSAEKFGEALSMLIDKVGIKLLAFPHKSFSRHAVSYDKLSRYAGKDVAFLSLNAPREEEGAINLSTMHELPFLGNDVYAVESPRFLPKPDKPGQGGTGSAKEEPKYEIKKEKIRFFNPDTLVIEPSALRMAKPDEILKEIGEVGNENMLRILKDYGIMDNDQDKLTVLRSFSKVHELKASTTEFQTVQQRIKNEESTEYVKGHDALEKTLKRLKESRKK